MAEEEQSAETRPRKARRALGTFVVILLCATAAAAIGFQIYTLAPVVRLRAEGAASRGKLAEALRLYTKLFRLRPEDSTVRPKMEEIAVAGLRRGFEESKALFAKGRPHEALAAFQAGMKLVDDFCFVFPSWQFLAPEDDALVAQLDAIEDDDCFMAKIDAMRCFWESSRLRLRSCQRATSRIDRLLLWQSYISLRTWDWPEAVSAVARLLRVSKMRAMLNSLRRGAIGKVAQQRAIRSLVPDTLKKDWELVESLSWFELSELMDRFGLTLVWPGPDPIGTTGVVAPCDIAVRSAGKQRGDFGDIVVNGKNVSENHKGYNVVVIEPGSGRVLASWHIIYSIKEKKIAWFQSLFRSLAPGTIVILAAKEESRVSPLMLKTFRSIGAEFAITHSDRTGWSHCVIGVKGAPPGSALEAWGPQASWLEVCGPREFGQTDVEIKRWLEAKARATGRPAVFLSGKTLDDKIIIAWP